MFTFQGQGELRGEGKGRSSFAGRGRLKEGKATLGGKGTKLLSEDL